MEMLATFDPYVILSLSLGLLLTLCIAIMILGRDRYAVPPHRVSRTIRCPERRSSARVDFVERVVNGMVRRSVQRCSLRGRDEQCGATCCHEPL